jgi:putative serine protease PepD
MSIRDGVEPSPQDADTNTQPLPGDARGEAAPEPAAAQAAPANPADETWPPSWGEFPSSRNQAPAASTQPPTWGQAPTGQGPTWSQGPVWPEPPGAQGPSWTQPAATAGATETQPAAPAPAADTTRTQPPTADDRPAWTGADQPQPGWGQGGGGGRPTLPTWGARPAGSGSPDSRRTTRWLAAVVAGVVLLASGYGISRALDRDDATPTGAGVPTAAPAVATPVPSASGSSQEPAAAVAKALLPTVVEISQGSGLGSGFIYDKSGYIMTAAHVVQGASQVDVRLYDGTKVSGRVVGIDETNDVAVVKISHSGLAAAPLGVNDTVQVGQLAVAIGSPFGLNETVTAGIISSTDRILDDGREVIQTDAPINPGNSGGVLANRQGRVIGINDAIQSGNGSDGNVGIGFAIPIDLAAKSATAIVQGKTVQTGYLGVSMAPATGGQDGALVQEVTQGSPADKAGLRVGDLVVAVDGQAVQSYSELGARIRAHKPGDKVTLKVIRDGNETTVTATLAQRPAG